MAVWAGVDVGGVRKGFHVAAVDDRRVVHRPVNVASVAETADLLASLAPLGQDDRDAIAAAWTARLCSRPDGVEWFGDIAVPI